MEDYFRGIVDLAAALGAPALVFGSPKNRVRGRLSEGAAWAIAEKFFRAVGEHAARSGVLCCVEPNPPEYGCDFLTTTREAADFVDVVENAGIRLQGDLGAIQLTEQTPAGIVRRYASNFGHFHVSEPHLAESGTRLGREGHEAVAASLREGGYRGWVSVEMADAGGLAALARAARFVAGVYAV
jgi:sugar phosphate isomerase/epimerase